MLEVARVRSAAIISFLNNHREMMCEFQGNLLFLRRGTWFPGDLVITLRDVRASQPRNHLILSCRAKQPRWPWPVISSLSVPIKHASAG